MAAEENIQRRQSWVLVELGLKHKLRQDFDAVITHDPWSTFAWFAFLPILSSLVGFNLALAVFLITFMRFRAGLTWPKASLYTGSGIGFMCFMAWVLNRDFPPGLLQSWFDLPWPLT